MGAQRHHTERREGGYGPSMSDQKQPATEPFVLVQWDVLDLKLAAGALALYVHLLRYTDADGTCWPKQSTLTEALGYSENTFRGYLAELVAAGLVARTRRGNGRSDIYMVSRTGQPLSPDAQKLRISLVKKEGADAQKLRISLVKKEGADAQKLRIKTLRNCVSRPSETEHAIKEELEPIELEPIELKGTTAHAVAAAAAVLCDEVGITTTPANLTAMGRLVERWGDVVDPLCHQSLLEMAGEARAYLDDPKRNKRKRTPSVSYFGNWVRRTVARAEQDKATAEQRQAAGAHGDQTAPAGFERKRREETPEEKAWWARPQATNYRYDPARYAPRHVDDGGLTVPKDFPR